MEFKPFQPSAQLQQLVANVRAQAADQVGRTVADALGKQAHQLAASACGRCAAAVWMIQAVQVNPFPQIKQASCGKFIPQEAWGAAWCTGALATAGASDDFAGLPALASRTASQAEREAPQRRTQGDRQ